MKNVNIGKLRLNGNLILAPMSGVTNLPFRLLCKKYGASLVYSEMASSEAIIRQNHSTLERGFTCKEERPLGIQLMGSDAGAISGSAILMQEMYGSDLIDINIGCPAQNIIKNGCGSELLKKPEVIRDIIKQVSGSIDVPLTAKIRVLDDREKTLEIARIIEKEGADAITIHGRTQKQGYSGKSNVDMIKSIKKELSIPVFANGDICNEQAAKNVLEYTQCDGLMIGRAAIGNPYIFRRISNYLEKGDFLPERTLEKKLGDFIEYSHMCLNFGMLNCNNLKQNAMWFTKGIENIKSVRMELNDVEDIGSILRIIGGLKENEFKGAG